MFGGAAATGGGLGAAPGGGGGNLRGYEPPNEAVSPPELRKAPPRRSPMTSTTLSEEGSCYRSD